MNGAAVGASDDAVRALGLDPARMPRHVAVIMDGNGRWAQKRGLLRTKGHRRGVAAVRDTTTECARLGVDWLTLYAFSTENWKRPQREVDYLMRLLAQFLVDERPTLLDNGVRLEAMGQLDRLPESCRQVLDETRRLTANGSRMTLTLALSYGGRDELVQAARAIAIKVAAGELDPASIDAATVQGHLFAPEIPDVDLLVRTAGEQRVSNFLPWQAVYAEFVSSPRLWPEFRIPDLHAALVEYQHRERRFGSVVMAAPDVVQPPANSEKSTRSSTR